MSGHELPAPFSADPLGAGRPAPTDKEWLETERGLGARYVAVRHSAAYHERRAATWRKWALGGWALVVVETVLHAVRLFA